MADLAIRRPDGTIDEIYTAQPHQRRYHESVLPNLIMVGPRGTGKSLCERMDAHMKAMSVPGYRYLIMRRTMPELKKSHLVFVGQEMHRLGGDFHITDSVARYPNGSLGWYGHCDTPADAMKYLSAEYDMVVADEITTFPGELILKMAACVRVPKDSGRIGMLRGGTNPLGVGADFVRQYFLDKNVPLEENEEYRPEEWGVITTSIADNKYLDFEQYTKRLKNLPAHVRKAWLEGEWVVEGAYFTDFRPFKDGEPWHVVTEMPRIDGLPCISQPWVAIYRAIDWGYSPDPAVCLWIAVLPNGRSLVFKERTWRETLAADVAKDIKRESAHLNIVDTFCDPSMLVVDGKGAYSIGELFEINGVPLRPSVNNRDLYGYAIHNYLNTVITEGGESKVPHPQLGILAPMGPYGCPNLIKTLPLLRIDPSHPSRIANGDDHWVVALAYFCMGQASPAQRRDLNAVPQWMRPKRQRSSLLVTG